MEKAPVDILWVAICAGLVFMMQAGFMCLEAGVTRRKNNINVAMKNLSDFGVSTVVFWLFGYAFMFGQTQGGWVGLTDFAPDMSSGRIWPATYILFQVMFCGTAATILAGAVAERMRFAAYLVMMVGRRATCRVPIFHWPPLAHCCYGLAGSALMAAVPWRWMVACLGLSSIPFWLAQLA
ncbi:MAG: hypothetical protein SH847_07600 [Roseiflexaceae bacterium]|nr:hypothetical protein [Roseiflexaceae bacterium]